VEGKKRGGKETRKREREVEGKRTWQEAKGDSLIEDNRNETRDMRREAREQT
jgi:hypothetical protein